MNEEPEGDERPEETNPPSTVMRVVRLVMCAVAVYVITLFLTLLFWAGFPNPNGLALIATAVFLAFAAFLSVRLRPPAGPR